MKNPLLLRNDPNRVFRSGSWDYLDARYSRVSFRNGHFASRRHHYRGFRLFRTQEKS